MAVLDSVPGKDVHDQPQSRSPSDFKFSEPESAHELSQPFHFTAADEKRLLRKQDARIMPLSAVLYFLNFIDRANIGNARILNSSTRDDMQSTLGMTDAQFKVAVILTTTACALFEVPSNVLIKKLRPSRWLAFLMFGWGSMTVALGGANNFAAVGALRFMLGVFEAGLWPGLVFYLTFWYRHDERSIRIAFLLSSGTLSGAFGGAIAYGVGHINGASGLAGWRWLFILEGIPSCLLAAVVLFHLPDFPEDTKWLSASEKALAAHRLRHEGNKNSQPSMTWAEAKSTLKDGRLWVHYALSFGFSASFSSLSIFAPSIVAGLGYRDLDAQLMTIPPWAAAYVCQILVAYSADRHNARGLHGAASALVAAAGFIFSATVPPTAYSLRYGGLVIATSGAFSCIAPLIGWLSSNVFSTASTGLAIALHTCAGAALGQIPGILVYMPGEAARGFPTRHWTNAGFMLFVVVLALGLRGFYGWRNGMLAAREGEGAMLYKL